jgi:hypothetical protein
MGDSERPGLVSKTENFVLDEPALMTRMGSRMRIDPKFSNFGRSAPRHAVTELGSIR